MYSPKFLIVPGVTGKPVFYNFFFCLHIKYCESTSRKIILNDREKFSEFPTPDLRTYLKQFNHLLLKHAGNRLSQAGIQK